MQVSDGGRRSVPVVPSRVTVLVCDGYRCRALRDRTDTGIAEGEAATLLGMLRERIRRSRDAVLIRSGCLGACAQAPAVCLVRGVGPAASGGHGVLYGPVESPAQVRALVNAVPIDDGRPAQ